MERSCDLLGAPGASRINILMIFIDFWLHLGTLWGGFWDILGSFLEALGSLGASWGLSWDFLGILGAPGGYWGAFGKLFVNIPCFHPAFPSFPEMSPQRDPPCPGPQRTPAHSTMSRPAAVLSALPRVPPRSCSQRAPQFFPVFLNFLQLSPASSSLFPIFPSKRLKKKAHLTADSSTKPSV